MLPGNKIEDLMEKLCSRRIDFYFAAITNRTAVMACIMQECYVHSHNAQFQGGSTGPASRVSTNYGHNMCRMPSHQTCDICNMIMVSHTLAANRQCLQVEEDFANCPGGSTQCTRSVLLSC